jgi:COP9 signalosome complex subunit 1
LKLAVHEAKEGKDVGLYQQICTHFQALAPDDPDAKQDAAWVTQTKREVQAEMERLEGELKGYKNNLIKESIRV